MGWVTDLILYIIVWWMVFFMVLPFGVRPDDAPEPGNIPSAPARPRLLLKAGITTAVATLVWLGLRYAIASDIFSVRSP